MNKLTILLLAPFILASCTQKESITGTWICGNYLDSAAVVIQLTDSCAWDLNSYIPYKMVKISVSDSQISIDSGYFSPSYYHLFYASQHEESNKLSYHLQNNTLKLFDHDNNQLEFKRCDKFTKQQQVFAGKLLLIDLPLGFNDRNDWLSCPDEIYIGKPKSCYNQYMDSTTYPYAIQMGDRFRSIYDIRDFVTSTGKNPLNRTVILVDKDTPMSIIHNIKIELMRCNQPYVFAVINEHGKISYIKTGWVYPDFFPDDIENCDNCKEMIDELAKYDKNRVTIDSLGQFHFHGKIIPHNHISSYFKTFLDNSTELVVFQLCYHPNATIQPFIDFFNLISSYRHHRQISDPSYDLVGEVDYGLNK